MSVKHNDQFGHMLPIPEYVSNKPIHANIGLSNDVLAPHYDAIEKRLSVKPVGDHLLGGSSHVIARGAKRSVLITVHSTKHCRMQAECSMRFRMSNGAKQSMHLTYVPDAIRHGATVNIVPWLNESPLKAIAVGVEVVSEENQSRTRISADVIVSAAPSVLYHY